MSIDDCAKVVETHLAFLISEFDFVLRIKREEFYIIFYYQKTDFNIEIAYGATEWRLEITFKIFGENCVYKDFFRLKQFSENIFTNKENQDFTNIIDFDILYLKTFLKKYLAYILKNMTLLYSAMRKNGHLGYKNIIYPFSKDRDSFIAEKLKQLRFSATNIKQELPLCIKKYFQRNFYLYLSLERSDHESSMPIFRNILSIKMDNAILKILTQGIEKMPVQANLEYLKNQVIQQVLVTEDSHSSACEFSFICSNSIAFSLFFDIIRNPEPVKFLR